MLLIFFVLFAFVCYLVKKRFRYWSGRKVPFLRPKSLVFGNCQDFVLGRISLVEYSVRVYDDLKPYPFGGIYNFWNPCFIARHPDIVKLILSQDFQYFTDRNPYFARPSDPLQHNVLHLNGGEWKYLRKRLTSTFSSGKIKSMFPLVDECVREMVTVVEERRETGSSVNTKDLMSRYTLDVISSCAFGLELHSLKNANSEFLVAGNKVFASRYWGSLSVVWPYLAHVILRIPRFPTETCKFYDQVVRDTLRQRREKKIFRHDFLNLLKNLAYEKNYNTNLAEQRKRRNSSSSEAKEANFDINFVSAQCILFFTAGYETSSNTLSFALFELARNLRIQKKAQTEIDEIFESNDNRVNYELLYEFRYTDQIIEETLRKYPVTPFLMRSCSRSYTIPNTGVRLSKGTNVFIPVCGLHNDPKYFPYPERFDPDRFSETKKQSLPAYVYLPYGGGPRNCLGMRFGVLQVKLALVKLLREYEFYISKKMILPLKFKNHTFLTSCETEIWLDCVKRNNS